MSKIGSAVSEEKSFENVNGRTHGRTDARTDGRTDGRTDDGRKVITIAHPEQSSGELKTVRNCVQKTQGGRSQYRRSCGEPRVTLTLTLEKKQSEIVLKRPGEAGLNIAVVAGNLG